MSGVNSHSQFPIFAQMKFTRAHGGHREEKRAFAIAVFITIGPNVLQLYQ
jgi:hypothetical protein